MAGAHNSNTYHQHHRIPQGDICDLRFEFYVQPPVTEKDESFKGDVAIIDQFGNEHWLLGLEFPYVYNGIRPERRQVPLQSQTPLGTTLPK